MGCVMPMRCDAMRCDACGLWTFLCWNVHCTDEMSRRLQGVWLVLVRTSGRQCESREYLLFLATNGHDWESGV